MSVRRAGHVTDIALIGLAAALPLSIAVSELLLGVALVGWLATAPWRRPAPPGMRALGLATAALAAAWLLSCATAVDPWASLVNARKLYSIGLVFVVADRMRAPREADRLVLAALLGGAASAIFGVISFFSIRLSGTSPAHRMRGLFSTAMTSGNVYATLGLVALGRVASPSTRGAIPFAALGVLGVALGTTLTRSSWLAFTAGAAVLLARRRPRWLVAGAVLAALALSFGPAELRDRARSILDPTHVTNQGRLSLWKSGIAVVGDHPWTGVGLADHGAIIAAYRRPDATFEAGHFHNNLVQIGASTGLVGLAAYLAWMAVALVLLVGANRRSDSVHAQVGLAVWAAFQVHGMFDWSFGDVEVVNQFFLWVGLGLAAGASGAGRGPLCGLAWALPPAPPGRGAGHSEAFKFFSRCQLARRSPAGSRPERHTLVRFSPTA